MRNFQDLTGQKFGKLTVLKRAENRGKKTCWLCKCECGNEKIINAVCLKTGNTKSCGCLKKEPHNLKHNLCNTRIYNIYRAMKGRCYNKNNSRYKNYGARGITVCQEWLDDFMNFYNWAIENGYKENLTIDRIDVNGNYEPLNCRWATYKEQGYNTTKSIYYTYNNQTHSLAEWCKILNLKYNKIWQRINILKKDFKTAINK